MQIIEEIEKNGKCVMEVITEEELNEIIRLHVEWLSGKGGKRANLSWANLSGANLRGAGLCSAVPASMGPASPGPTAGGPTSAGPTSAGPKQME